MVASFGDVRRMFEFHHVDPKEKSTDYKNLIRKKLCSDQLDELDKCILLCGNCHDILHSQEIHGALDFNIELEGKTASQTLNGSFIINATKQTATFLTNEKLYLLPFWMQCSVDDSPDFVFGTELNDGLLFELLGKMGADGSIRLFDYRTGEQKFQAHFTETQGLMIQHDVAINLPLELNPSADNNEDLKGWIRHGVALLSDGTVITSGVVSATLEHHNFL